MAEERNNIERKQSEVLNSELFKKIGSALFYGVTSTILTVINKNVLSVWQFPSFMVVSVGQLSATVIILYIVRALGIIKFPKFSRDIPKKVFPLPFFHFGNMASGLGGTQALSLPMFTAIRRFAILITMILEYKILHIVPSTAVQVSVWCMIGGAILAASDDLSFSLIGYSYVMLSNLITASYGVCIKKKLECLDVGKYGIIYYNSLFMIIPAVLLAYFLGDWMHAYNFENWHEPMFLIQFVASCVMGLMITYSTFLCTLHNSALTTAMVGCFKNVFVSYLGMFFGNDYVFSILNCIGINISIIGSIYYSYVIFTKKEEEQPPTTKETPTEQPTITTISATIPITETSNAKQSS